MPMDQRDRGARAMELKRGLGRRVLAADDDHLSAVIGMGLAIVVRDVRQVFPGDARLVGDVIGAGRDDDRARDPVAGAAGVGRLGRHREPAVRAGPGGR